MTTVEQTRAVVTVVWVVFFVLLGLAMLTVTALVLWRIAKGPRRTIPRTAAPMACPLCGQPLHPPVVQRKTRIACGKCGGQLVVAPRFVHHKQMRLVALEPQTPCPRLVLSRAPQDAGYGDATRFTVDIDGVRVGTIRELESVAYAVTPGRHEVTVHQWPRSCTPVVVEVPAGGEDQLVCGFQGGALEPLMDRGSDLYLTPVNQSEPSG